MRQTSILAFHSLDTGIINQRQREVLNALEEIYPANNRQISEHSHFPINTVTPRMGELVVKGKVEEAYRDLDPVTGRRSIFWKPKITSAFEFGDVS